MATKHSFHLRSNAPLLSNNGSDSLFCGSTPLFETLETTFADCNDSENDYLDDDEVDDDEYEYNTDEDWKTDEDIEDDEKPPPPQQLSHKTQSYCTALKEYKQFKIRSITIYDDLFDERKLKKYKERVFTEKMDKMERERHFIKKEIVETEKSYLKGLKCLLNEFIKPIFEEKMIAKKYEKEVTSIIPIIIKFHDELFEQLNIEFKKGINGDICSVFIKCGDFLKIYIDYIRQYHNILDIFAKHNKTRKLKKYLSKKRAQRKPLTNHLILPIQRVPRYMLLLDDLKKKTPLKHKNYNTLCSALNIINAVAQSINERKREIENMSQCLQVMESLRQLDRNIVEPFRKFLAQFLFRKKDNKRPRQFFLFSDLIIISNLKMKVKMVLEMRTIEIKLKDNGFTLYTAKGKSIEYETDIVKTNDIIQLNEIIIKSRLAVWDSDLSRIGNEGKSKQRDALNKSGVSQALQYRNQLETLQRLRHKKDQSALNVFKKSNIVKGKKDKVLEMLGQ